jgi:hypothetical protein
MQILHSFAGSIQRYVDEIADPDRHRPDHCPQCEAQRPLTGHGFYHRTLVDAAFDGVIRVRRYLCRCCKRTVSLLPEFVLPWLRFSLSVIALFLAARLLNGLTLVAAARAAAQAVMPYQRGQFWIRRFQKQAPALSLALVPLEVPGHPRRTSFPEPCECWNPSDGSPRIVSCFRSFASICWAGLWAPRALFPELPHTAFAWRKIAAPDYRSGHGDFPHGYQIRKTGAVSLRTDRAAGD